MLFFLVLNLYFEILVFLKMCIRVFDLIFICNYCVDFLIILFLVIY